MNVTTAVDATTDAAAAVGTDGPAGPYQHVAGLVFDLTAVYLGLLTVFGILNNALVLVLYARYRSLRNPINLFLVNISVGDLSVSVFGSPFTFASSVARGWLFGAVGCSWYAFIVTICGVEQIVALAAVSVHRCCIIVRPMTAQKMTTGWALLFIGLTWTYSLVVSIPPVVGWNSFVLEGIGTACSVDWTSTDFGDSSYIIFIFIMVLAIPLFLIIFSYSLLLYAVKKIAGSDAARTSQHKADKRVTVLVVIMITFFLLAWTPYSCFSLYLSIGRNHSISPVVSALPAMFAKSCTIYNPIIYFLMNQQFKNALVDMLCCGRNPFQRSESDGQDQEDPPHGPAANELAAGPRSPRQRGPAQPCSSGSHVTQVSEYPLSLGPVKIADWGAAAAASPKSKARSREGAGPAAEGAAAVTHTMVEAFKEEDCEPSNEAGESSRPQPIKKAAKVAMKRGKVCPAVPDV